MVSEFGFLSIEVIKMKKEDYVPDPRYADMKTSTKIFTAKKNIEIDAYGNETKVDP